MKTSLGRELRYDDGSSHTHHSLFQTHYSRVVVLEIVKHDDGDDLHTQSATEQQFAGPINAIIFALINIDQDREINQVAN